MFILKLTKLSLFSNLKRFPISQSAMAKVFNIAVTGPAGCGKTSFIGHLATISLGWKVPVKVMRMASFPIPTSDGLPITLNLYKFPGDIPMTTLNMGKMDKMDGIIFIHRDNNPQMTQFIADYCYLLRAIVPHAPIALCYNMPKSNTQPVELFSQMVPPPIGIWQNFLIDTDTGVGCLDPLKYLAQRIASDYKPIPVDKKISGGQKELVLGEMERKAVQEMSVKTNSPLLPKLAGLADEAASTLTGLPAASTLPGLPAASKIVLPVPSADVNTLRLGLQTLCNPAALDCLLLDAADRIRANRLKGAMNLISADDLYRILSAKTNAKPT